MSVILAIVGPTASGKTPFAISVAEKIGGEIICMDSTTVYRGFDIGTSKPSPEEKARVPHHLIDVADPDELFSAGHFVRLAEETISDIFSRRKTPVIAGGTYFYLRALQHGMNPVPVVPNETIETIEQEFFIEEGSSGAALHAELAKVDETSAKLIHPNDRYRLVRALAIFRFTGKKASELKPEKPSGPPRHWMKYALCPSRHVLTASIVSRTEKMLKEGLVEETRKLKEKYPKARALGAVGYAETVAFLEKRLTEKQLRNEIVEKTRQLAKRQVTWLRSDTELRFVDSRDADRVALETANLKFALGEDR